MDDPEQAARERAERRVAKQRDFFRHLFVYLAVCALLVVIDLADGNHGTSFLGLNWAYWPLFGWGLAVAMHGLQTFLDSGWEERKVKQYMDEERRDQ